MTNFKEELSDQEVASKEYAKQFDFAEDSSPEIDFQEGAKWQSKRMYSEEEIIFAMKNAYGIKYFSEKKFLENLKALKKKP